MGRCPSTIKVAGVTSLGLLTGSLAFQSWQMIPLLIRQLNGVSTNEQTLSILGSVSNTFTLTNIINLALAVCSTGLFTMAYKYATPSAKHPYLIYSALGAPVALITFFYGGCTAQRDIRNRSGGKPEASVDHCARKLDSCVSKAKSFMGKRCCRAKGKCDRNAKNASTAETAQPTSTESAATAAVSEKPEVDNLGLSYIHVSEDSSTSTPTASVPGSPLPAAATAASSSSLVEEEVDYALNKKAYVLDLEVLKRSNTIAAGVAATGLFIGTIGIVGEQLYY